MLRQLTFRTRVTQRQGDGKDCAPLPPKEWGVRPASLATFFLDLELGEGFALRDAWNLSSEGKGVGLFSGWSVQPKGPVQWHWSILIHCMRVRVWTDMHALHSVRTTSTTTTTTSVCASLPGLYRRRSCWCWSGHSARSPNYSHFLLYF